MSVYVRLSIYCTTFAAASQTFGVSLKGVRLHHGVEQQVNELIHFLALAPSIFITIFSKSISILAMMLYYIFFT